MCHFAMGLTHCYKTIVFLHLLHVVPNWQIPESRHHQSYTCDINDIILNAVDYIVTVFFLPRTQNSVMRQKFWSCGSTCVVRCATEHQLRSWSF